MRSFGDRQESDLRGTHRERSERAVESKFVPVRAPLADLDAAHSAIQLYLHDDD